jgi:GTPase SAR1 family protein
VQGPAGPAGRAEAGEGEADDAVDQVREVTVALVGQVKAGKSSLVNALLGEQRARTDVLPATGGVERYQLQPPDIPTRLVLLDTVGYAHAGPRADQLAATREAAGRRTWCCWCCTRATRPARPTSSSWRTCAATSRRTPT